jgi:hypothetical protein
MTHLPPASDAPSDTPTDTPLPPRATHAPAHAAHAVHAAPRPNRRVWWLVGAAVVVIAVVLLFVLLPGGKSTPPKAANGSPNSGLVDKNNALLSQISHYNSTVKSCPSAKSPTTCLEAADRALGDQVHNYANYMTQIAQLGSRGKDVAKTLNAAQNTANAFELVGDSEPTAAAYKQALGTFDISKALSTLEADVSTVIHDFS